jgi:tetratricopeptide (TPR) repeat protein
MRKATGVCLVLLAMTACNTKRGYVEKGNTLSQQGKYQDATINYRKAIQKDPNYGEAYYRLGLAAIKLNTPVDAYDALFRASQLLPDNIEVQEKFAGMCLEYYVKDPTRPQKLYLQAEQASERLLAHNPNSFEGLRIKGYLAYADRKPQEAITYFRKAMRIQPDSAPVTVALAQTLIENGQSQEGEKLALDLLARRKDYGPTYDTLYKAYSNSNRMADAEKILRSKVDNNPRNIDYILELAAHYARGGNTAGMTTTLQRMLDDPKDFPNAHLRVGDFYVQQKKYSESIRAYEEGARAHPSEKVLYQERALAALLADKKYEDASRLVQQILKENPKDELALRIRADLLITAGGAENGTAALDILQNQLSERQDDDNPALRLQLGRAARLKGDLELAHLQFSEALRMRRDYLPAQYELAEVSLLQQHPAEALIQANAILARIPNDYRARFLRARGLAATRNFVQARVELTQLLKDAPQDLDVRLELGSLAFRQRKFHEAIETLSALKNSGDPRVFAGLIAAYTRQGQIDKAMEVANEGFKRSPDATLIREQLVESAASGGRFDLAISECKKLVASNPKSVAERRRLGEIYELKGDHDQAIVSYRQASELAPHDLAMAVVLGDALARASRFKEATTQFRDILKVHPDDAGVLNDLAFLLADTGGDLNEALTLEQRAMAKDPKQAAFSDTMGYIYLKKGQHDSAMQTFGSLVRQYPHFAAFRYHLGLVMLAKGDKASAKKQLQGALAEHPSMQDKIRIKELLAKIS